MISLELVQQDLENNHAILLDVREQKEWEEDRLPLARLVPLSQMDQGAVPKDLPQDKRIYIHCRIGGRAEYAAEILKKYYAFVIPLMIPFDVLKKAKYPLGSG